MYEPGSVTRRSLLGRQALDPEIPRQELAMLDIRRTHLLCEQHDGLTGNRELLDNLLGYLLAPDS